MDSYIACNIGPHNAAMHSCRPHFVHTVSEHLHTHAHTRTLAAGHSARQKYLSQSVGLYGPYFKLSMHTTGHCHCLLTVFQYAICVVGSSYNNSQILRHVIGLYKSCYCYTNLCMHAESQTDSQNAARFSGNVQRCSMKFVM
jgi:hypothetical protein